MTPDEIMAAHKAKSDGGLVEASLPIRLKLHPEILGELPQEIEPTMESALGIFHGGTTPWKPAAIPLRRQHER